MVLFVELFALNSALLLGHDAVCDTVLGFPEDIRVHCLITQLLKQPILSQNYL